MRLRLKALVLCAALATAPVTALAQHGRHVAADTSAQLLRSMTVTADRERVMLRSGRTIVDPRAIAASSGSIADLLRAIPGVEIDADGDVSMRGNAHALVLINGRRTALSGEALIAWLRAMRRASDPVSWAKRPPSSP